MLGLLCIILGMGLLVGSCIKASTIEICSSSYKNLMDIGNFGFWLGILGLILIIWG